VLAHVQVVDPADLPRFGALGVYAAFSPLWAYPDEAITRLTWPVLGPERSAWLYPMAAVARAGGTLVAGSDWSVTSMDPFDAMEVAVTRRDPDGGGPALAPQHRVSVAEILAAYTLHGARASFVEDELGSIAVGKRADLIVLDRDPLAIDAGELSEIQVLLTLLDGREVHRAPPPPR
jgi:predicted amidohydrolase YtcJ